MDSNNFDSSSHERRRYLPFECPPWFLPSVSHSFHYSSLSPLWLNFFLSSFLFFLSFLPSLSPFLSFFSLSLSVAIGNVVAFLISSWDNLLLVYKNKAWVLYPETLLIKIIFFGALWSFLYIWSCHLQIVAFDLLFCPLFLSLAVIAKAVTSSIMLNKSSERGEGG
jgi:hypothetical protein